MSNLIYKTKERYEFGWTDPRAMIDPRMPHFGKTGLEATPIDVLKDLWVVSFGDRVVKIEDIGKDVALIVRELCNRAVVTLQLTAHPDTDKINYYYVMDKKVWK